MSSIIEFFISPYQNTAIAFILLEFVAALFGIMSVVYARKENILVFPIGIISTGIYIYLLYRWQLYGDLVINIYYTAMSLYGWYMWWKVIGVNSATTSISKLKIKDYLMSIGIFVFSSSFIAVVYIYFDVISAELNLQQTLDLLWTNITSGSLADIKEITPYMDIFTTGAAFVAMWMMANKKLESWIVWIVVNIVSIPLYFIKGFGFTGIQYFVFLVLAVLGYLSWKKILHEKN
jgi:nicotinamide mononucleotide transporter